MLFYNEISVFFKFLLKITDTVLQQFSLVFIILKTLTLLQQLLFVEQCVISSNLFVKVQNLIKSALLFFLKAFH